jgi:hypothetical protein
VISSSGFGLLWLNAMHYFGDVNQIRGLHASYASHLNLGEKSRDIAALWVQSRGMLLLNPRPNGKLARAIGPRSPRTIQLMEKNDRTPPRFLHLCLSHLIFPLDSLSRRFNAGPIGHIHSHDAGVSHSTVNENCRGNN